MLFGVGQVEYSEFLELLAENSCQLVLEIVESAETLQPKVVLVSFSSCIFRLSGFFDELTDCQTVVSRGTK